MMDYMILAVLIGMGATAVMDTWTIARSRLLGVPSLDYGLVGRWFAYLPRGRFRHDPISASPPMRYERVIGWVAHYASGIAFAGILLGVWGVEWSREPTLGPALVVGISTVAAPFLLMQPGMGAGIAASRTPNPNAARLQSVVTHGIFGLGLYASGWAVRWLSS